MSEHLAKNVAKPEGKLAVLIPGLGAVATTFIAGVDAIRARGRAAIGSFTQLGMLPLKDEIGSIAPVHKVLPLAELEDLVFGGWDIYEGSAYDAVLRSSVLNEKDTLAAKPLLESIIPMPAVFDQAFVKNLAGPNVKSAATKWDLAEAVIEDIHTFVKTHGASRAVGVWCGSTEVYTEIQEVHQSLEAFEKGLKENHPAISPSMIYAYAFAKSKVPYANGAPNLAVDCPAIIELANATKTPIAGRDFKTGQTLMKTILAPGIAARNIGVHGWYSTNILGNTDGVVLDDPASFKTKETSKLSVLDSVFDAKTYPDLYGDVTHTVRIDYYPPRGDNKEGWDNIDIFGWMGYPMQIKVNFLCRDSILAAPLVLDLAIFLDLAGRAGYHGVIEWLSYYFKAPQTTDPDAQPVHDLFQQQTILHDELRKIAKR